MVKIFKTCPFCGKEHTVKVSYKGFDEWTNGALIQVALPELSATEREQLISGMCPDCQRAFFGEDEEF